MPRKIKPRLTELGSTVYAVLSPGVGYLKYVAGFDRGFVAVFTDVLPRASGCFMTYEEADAARAKVLETSYTKWQNSMENSSWYVNRRKETYDAAAKAVVVTISVA